MDRRVWTEGEIETLRSLYLSGRAFEEVDNALPLRSPSAIRQKASRMGLKRPVVSHSLCDSRHVLKCTNGADGDGYLFKCAECGGWIHVDSDDSGEGQTVVCPTCETICKFVN